MLMKLKRLLSLISLLIIILVLTASVFVFHIGVYSTQPDNSIIHNILNVTSLQTLPNHISRTIIHNGVKENVTLGFNEFYYYVNISFSNLRNSSIILHTCKPFKPNTSIGILTPDPLSIEILNPLND